MMNKVIDMLYYFQSLLTVNTIAVCTFVLFIMVLLHVVHRITHIELKYDHAVWVRYDNNIASFHALLSNHDIDMLLKDFTGQYDRVKKKITVTTANKRYFFRILEKYFDHPDLKLMSRKFNYADCILIIERS